MQTATTKELGEMFETFVSAKKFDDKGREIGFTVGFRDNGKDFYAWVQAARRVGLNGEAKDFGPVQRSKLFKSQQAANFWAYSTARERTAKIK